MNEYFIKARLYPAVITLVPILSLYYFLLNDKIEEVILFLNGYSFIGDITISIALIFLLIQVNRFVSKQAFQRFYFKNEVNMPTTNMLMHTNEELSRDEVNKIINKIKTDYDIDVPVPQFQIENELESRKVIVGAVSQIKNYSRGDEMIYRHNTEFGFIRNLLGGCLVSCFVCAAALLLSLIKPELGISNLLYIILFTVYLLPILFSKKLINSYGKTYAKILYRQFLSKN